MTPVDGAVAPVHHELAGGRASSNRPDGRHYYCSGRSYGEDFVITLDVGIPVFSVAPDKNPDQDGLTGPF